MMKKENKHDFFNDKIKQTLKIKKWNVYNKTFNYYYYNIN
jgi:hypothetical protein